MVMELLTYQKLRAVRDLVPEDVLATWQPPQAVRSLVEFQPLADRTFTLDVGELPADTPFDQQQWVRVG
jgi:hypothetical protein